MSAGEHLLDALIERSELLVGSLDADFRFTFVGQEYARAFGLDAVDAIGKTPHEVFPEPLADLVVADAREVLETGKAFVGLASAVVAEQARTYRYRRFPMLDAQGRPAGVGFTGFDITEEEETNRLLRVLQGLGATLSATQELDEGLKHCIAAALEAAMADAAAIFLFDGETGALEMVVSKGLSESFASEAARYPADTTQAKLVAAGKPHHMDFEDPSLGSSPARRAEGLKGMVVIPLLVHGQPVGSLNVASRSQNTFGSAANLALETLAAQIGNAIWRLQLTEALASSEERYRLLVAGATDAVLIHEFEDDGTPGPILEANEAACRVFGMSVAEMRTVPLFDLAAPAPGHDFEEAASRLMAERHTSTVAVVTRYDGSSSHLEIRSHLVRLRGRPTAISIMRDITQRLRHEATIEASRVELQALAARLAETSENERRHIAAELHDSVTQTLTGVKFSLEATLKEARKSCPEGISEALRTAISDLGVASEQIRNVITELRPTVLEHFGLRAALEDLAQSAQKRFGVTVEVEGEEPGARLPEDVGLVLYRVAQEALSNACRHSDCESVRLKLHAVDGTIQLQVRDDGCGFCVAEEAEAGRGQHLGLLTMRERVTAVGGAMAVETAPGCGTTVRSTVPWARSDPS